eukprot:NODE_22035_length_725_cov_4.075251.p4 GENE.NODE_22035_length_725_cov_4.075251~~NODE_22035_length_725_cov_4.075251.p4  ORF type:complete len:81 (+),score=18.03 NODE_22035_length_725_cov_4.075251:59-301(+)
MPWAAFDITAALTRPVNPGEFVASFQALGLRGVVPVVHSKGSAPLAWLLRSPQARPLVRSAALFEATMLHNFSSHCLNLV